MHRRRVPLDRFMLSGLGFAVGRDAAPVINGDEGAVLHRGYLATPQAVPAGPTPVPEGFDFIVTAHALLDSVPDGATYDFAILDHVLQFLPDPVSFLARLELLLVPGAPVIAICDNAAPAAIAFETPALLEAYLERRLTPSFSQMFVEQRHRAAMAVRRNGLRRPPAHRMSRQEFVRAYDTSMELMTAGCWTDPVRCWDIDPEMIPATVGELRRLGKTGFVVQSCSRPARRGGEFWIHLVKEDG